MIGPIRARLGGVKRNLLQDDVAKGLRVVPGPRRGSARKRAVEMIMSAPETAEPRGERRPAGGDGPRLQRQEARCCFDAEPAAIEIREDEAQPPDHGPNPAA